MTWRAEAVRRISPAREEIAGLCRMKCFVLLILVCFLVSVLSYGCAGFTRRSGNEVTSGFVKESTLYYINIMTTPHEGLFKLRRSSSFPEAVFQLAEIKDPVWTFVRGDHRVYFTHSRFLSVDSDDTMEVDFWLVPFGNKMRVVDIKIHRVNDEVRFAYDDYHIRELDSES